MLASYAHRGIAALLACLLVVTAFPVPLPAGADEASELEARVKESAASYNAAVQRQEQLAAEISELSDKIGELEAELPQQQERSDESVRALYKYSYDTSSMVSLILDSSSLTDMLALVDSYSWVIDHNIALVEQAQKTKAELEHSRKKVESDKAAADEQAADAASALDAAKAAREEARQRALAAQAAEEQQARDSGSKAEKEESATASKQASADNVGWDADKTAFVNKWAPRIDDYLSGSPTAGTGRAYAVAAWDNGVDPRWAPAISLVESSKGAACFAAHNAWGYGGSGFSSWEEGINTVVGALGGPLYGGYLTKQAAKTYCPPTWQSWYGKCAAEMAKI